MLGTSQMRIVAKSPVALHGMCDSPRTGCGRRTTILHIQTWGEQATIEWSRLVISIVACCHSAKLRAHAAWLSDRNKMVLWPGCEGRAVWNLHTKSVRSVRFVVKRMGCCCNISLECAIPHEQDVREEQHPYICGANKQYQSNHSMWTLLLLAATVRSFAHMPLGIFQLQQNNDS